MYIRIDLGSRIVSITRCSARRNFAREARARVYAIMRLSRERWKAASSEFEKRAFPEKSWAKGRGTPTSGVSSGVGCKARMYSGSIISVPPGTQPASLPLKLGMLISGTWRPSPDALLSRTTTRVRINCSRIYESRLVFTRALYARPTFRLRYGGDDDDCYENDDDGDSSGPRIVIQRPRRRRMRHWTHQRSEDSVTRFPGKSHSFNGNPLSVSSARCPISRSYSFAKVVTRTDLEELATAEAVRKWES